MSSLVVQRMHMQSAPILLSVKVCTWMDGYHLDILLSQSLCSNTTGIRL